MAYDVETLRTYFQDKLMGSKAFAKVLTVEYYFLRF